MIDGIESTCDMAMRLRNSGAGDRVMKAMVYNHGTGTIDWYGDVHEDPTGVAGFTFLEFHSATATGIPGTQGGGHAPDTYSEVLGDTQNSSVTVYAGATLASTTVGLEQTNIQPQSGAPGTIADLRKSIYDNKALLSKINDCLKSLLKNNFSKVGEQTLANAPKINATLTSAQLAAKYTGGASTYATGVGNVGGKYGTIFIGKEWFGSATDWTVNGHGGQPGRTPLQNAYIHELGNIASFIASGGTTYKLFGAKPAGGLVPTDDDSGYALQACVFNEQINMKKP
jgi:hypothetical protein